MWPKCLPDLVAVLLVIHVISRHLDGTFVDGVNVGSLVLMAVVTFKIGRAALVDVPMILLATVSALLLIFYRVNSAWLVLRGAFAGLLLYGKG